MQIERMTWVVSGSVGVYVQLPNRSMLDYGLKTEAYKHLNGVSATLGFYHDGGGNQIRYFTNTTANGERRLEDFLNPNINAVPHLPPIDYLTIQVGGFGVSGSGSVNLLNGEAFVGGGKSTFSSVPGVSIVGGKMIGGLVDVSRRADTVTNMLGGGGIQGTICTGGICGGINQSFGPVGSNPASAVELGIGTPGISGGVGAAVQLNKSGAKK